MPLSDRMSLLLLVIVWGCNFSAIQIALQELSPLLLSALRFALVALPAVLLFPPPAIRPLPLICYGLLMFAVQFALLFAGMKLGVSAGLASLVLQAQVFMTMGFAAALLRERPRAHQVLGAGVAAAGLAVVGLNVPGTATGLGLLCVLGAALTWAAANVLSKTFGRVHTMSLVAWGSLVATLPLAAAALALDGPAAVRASLGAMSWKTVAAVAYIVYPATLLGFAIWSRQLGRHPAARVVPFTLLVPVVGMLASAALLGEALQPWKLLAAALVLAGLGVNQFGQHLPWMKPRQRA